MLKIFFSLLKHKSKFNSTKSLILKSYYTLLSLEKIELKEPEKSCNLTVSISYNIQIKHVKVYLLDENNKQ